MNYNFCYNQKNKDGTWTNLAWFWYNLIVKFKFHLSATSKRTSTGLGNQDGFNTDLPNAPPLSLKLEHTQFKQERTQWIKLKSLGLKCT